ncbi:lipid-A-disaccharide synthase [Nitrincola sp. A-D6]|uniref:lipid-A-disaccharide synthase n=1 Tax=Nitrincola sp. A-D6 TaxID=1545442 RepID=UPI00051FE997|nr:lipid-A-disaccharide synthase [Nitrincola sp. A-D6]KGK42516.1 lipid-A-disaccharide synthase [Nitrincola sp. A-D6]
MSTPLRIAMVAGEASGDILGAGLLAELKQRYPDLQAEGIGGELMQAQGFHSLFPMERLSVMGLTEVLGRLPELLGIRRQLVQRWRATPPDLLIGIDAPDFTLRLERKLHDAGIHTVHYVSPSVWAWRRKRVEGIKRSTDLMLTLFPFEADFYRDNQQRVAFVGHPLADKFTLEPDTQAARKALGVAEDACVIALLPGSRGGEVGRLAQPFLQAARLLHSRRPSVEFLIPAANQARFDSLQTLIQTEFSDLPIRLVLKQSDRVMTASNAILIASGTATLEALFCKKPMVVAYKMAPLTYRIISSLVKSRWISLPNLLAQKSLVPEILQDAVTPERLCDELERWLSDPKACQQLTTAYTQIHQSLRGGASQRAADAVEALLRDKQVVL